MTSQAMPDSSTQLIEKLYDELRRLAQARLRQQRPGHTLQPTALVNEAYLRLVKPGRAPWNGDGHFFAAAAQAMRDILVEHARRHAAKKRGGDLVREHFTVTIADPEGDGEASAEQLLDLDAALDEMQKVHPAKAELVMLRYFAGLQMKEIAEITGNSLATVERQWRFARAWLRNHLEPGPTA